MDNDGEGSGEGVTVEHELNVSERRTFIGDNTDDEGENKDNG
jgi:hypothetical protein